MNRNQLKILACISMVVDHIGYVMLPDIAALRIIGRIAMPVFAFFIGEGCLYTRDRKKYFLRLFLLACICQAVNIAESVITGSGNAFYLNILFTFSLSILLCCSFIDFIKKPEIKKGGTFIALLVGFYLLCLFFDKSKELTGTAVTLDYGFGGICLPLFAAAFTERKKKVLFFGFGILSFMIFSYGFSLMHIIMGLVTAIILMSYNGQSGKKNLKYFFYLFYPLHVAVIYLLDMLISL